MPRQWCFYINLPIGGAAGAIILLTFTAPAAARPHPATPREKVLQMDVAGTATIMGAVICYLLALQWGGVTKPWSDGSVVGTLVAFGVLLILFVLIQWYQGDRALIPFRLLNDRNIAANCAYIFFLAGSFFVLLYILPIYFQSVKGTSAGSSGVRNLPLVFGASLFTILCGVIITVTGIYVPIMIVGAAITTIGCGLLYLLDLHSDSAAWIGYQIVAGIGVGLAVQIAVIANQGLVKISDLSTVSSITLFSQTIGGAFFVSASQTAFENKVRAKIPSTAPGVDPQLVIATGATQLRKVFSKADLPGVLEAYMDGIRVTFALAIALGGASLLVSLVPKWINIKGRLPTTAGAA